MTNPPGKTPQELIDELGITKPEELKIEAIAFYCGATIVYEPLSGCEANIVGRADRAIITVSSNSIPARQRFSAGHELGHWMSDRGQIAFGCSQKQIDSQWTADNPETRANEFASELLLPTKLFVPLAAKRPITVDTVRDLGRTFQMSLTATAIKLVRFGSFPSMLVYYEAGERKWFIPSQADLPKCLWPARQPGARTETAKLMSDDLSQQTLGDTRSDEWFDVPKAERYYLRESCFKTAVDSIVALLWWKDEAQIIDLQEEEERRAARRSDWNFSD